MDGELHDRRGQDRIDEFEEGIAPAPKAAVHVMSEGT